MLRGTCATSAGPSHPLHHRLKAMSLAGFVTPFQPLTPIWITQQRSSLRYSIACSLAGASTCRPPLRARLGGRFTIPLESRLLSLRKLNLHPATRLRGRHVSCMSSPRLEYLDLSIVDRTCGKEARGVPLAEERGQNRPCRDSRGSGNPQSSGHLGRSGVFWDFPGLLGCLEMSRDALGPRLRGGDV